MYFLKNFCKRVVISKDNEPPTCQEGFVGTLQQRLSVHSNYVTRKSQTKTSKDIWVELCQDVSLVLLRHVIKEHIDKASERCNNEVLLVCIYDVSN